MSFKAPKQTLQTLYGAGKKRAGLTTDALALQAFMAGVRVFRLLKVNHSRV